MELFKRKKEERVKEHNTNNNQIPPKSKTNGFKSVIKVDGIDEKLRYLKLKEDLVEGKISEKDLSDEDLDSVIVLLKEEIAQNSIKIKKLEGQIAKHKKNN